MNGERQLRERLYGELRTDLGGRLAYATDASIYRVLPAAVVVAAVPDDVRTALAFCRENGVPLTVRGAGTGMAGQALGEGLVVDCSRLDRILALDPETRTARVEPGVVQAHLDRAAAENGLCLGPDTASAARATIGGMVAIDSAGMRSVVYGRTSHRVRRLRVLRADGGEEWLEATPRAVLPEPWRSVVAIADAHRAEVEARWPRLLRCVDGYNLPALGGPEPHLARFLCGSEGTLGIVLEAELELDPLPERRAWSVVGLDALGLVGAAAPAAVAGGASAVELLDAALLPSSGRDLAGGAATILLVEHSGGEDAIAAGRGMLDDLEGIVSLRHVDEPGEQRALMRLRRDVLGLAARPDGGRRATSVHEDAAVPPERLGEYLDALHALLRAEGTSSVTTGHASVGCIHVQPLLDLADPGDRRRLRRIAEAAADLVVELGGAISGEHGDGISRSELLPRLFGETLVGAFAEIRRTLDPDGILNPGKIVGPWPLDERLRAHALPRGAGRSPEAEACVGIAACRDRLAGAMCPPFRILRTEESSTRGMANLLREALAGRIERDDPRLAEALGACVGCKACRSECPAGVDMSWLKASHPASAQSRRLAVRERLFAELPRLLGLAARLPVDATALQGTAPGRAAASLLGIDPRRRLPRLAPRRLRRLLTSRPAPVAPDVVLFADTFSRLIEPGVALAALSYLEQAGARPLVVGDVCCGRTHLSAGRLGTARALARRSVARLAPLARAGLPIVGLEPSCLLTFRDEVPRLLHGDPDAALVAEHALLFEEALDRWPAPPLRPSARTYLVHPHCHTRSLGTPASIAAALTQIPDARVETLEGGCCGMAGAFGYRAERYELSHAIAQDRLVPSLAAAPDAVVVAQGVSCRAQIRDVDGRSALHPAEALARQLVRAAP